MAREFIAEAPQPPLFKRNPRLPRRQLPAAAPQEDEFLRVLLARKTHRDFSGAPVTLEALSTLLRYTWGALGTIPSPNFGALLHKTSPSGGARHPGEVYVAALNVKGLARGLYHYSVKDHALEQIRRGPMRRAVLRYTLGQKHVGNACAVCFMTAVFPRSMFKYRSPRAYRIVTLDAGHLAQTFCLVATWLGLAPFTTAAVADTAIERALDIDGVAESIMYVAGVGMPRAAKIRGTSGRR
jgi:SagB-type dehydrogenase family enzyme